MTDEKPTLTITLTGRAPVTIRKDDWPVIASASDKDFDGQYEFQANRVTKTRLTVRQHSDGRAIVYGVYDYTTRWQGERDKYVRGGELLDAGADIPQAVHRVATIVGAEGIAEECVADLPAVAI